MGDQSGARVLIILVAVVRAQLVGEEVGAVDEVGESGEVDEATGEGVDVDGESNRQPVVEVLPGASGIRRCW